MNSIKIVVADDHRIVREGIINLLSGEVDMEVIGEAVNGREAVKLVEKLTPDITLMDISMPELNGIDAILKIKQKLPDARIIVLSMHSEHDFIWKTFKAGAYGYLLKDCAADELVTAIRRVKTGKKYISEDISDVILNDFVDSKWHDDKQGDNIPLSDREREVLQMMAEGNSTKEIADVLFISAKTVESHRKNITEKLQLNSLADLTKYAIRNGLTSLE
jgi:DNA-binding NarL/FixJ family response regulator